MPKHEYHIFHQDSIRLHEKLLEGSCGTKRPLTLQVSLAVWTPHLDKRGFTIDQDDLAKIIHQVESLQPAVSCERLARQLVDATLVHPTLVHPRPSKVECRVEASPGHWVTYTWSA